MYIHFEYMNLSKFSGPESDFNSVAYKKKSLFWIHQQDDGMLV